MIDPVAGAVVTLLCVTAMNSPGATTIGDENCTENGRPVTGVPAAAVGLATLVEHSAMRLGAFVVPAAVNEAASAVAMDTAVCPKARDMVPARGFVVRATVTTPVIVTPLMYKFLGVCVTEPAGFW